MKKLVQCLEEISNWYNIASAAIYKIEGKTIAELKRNVKPFERQLEHLMNSYQPIPHSVTLHYKSDTCRMKDEEKGFYNDRLQDHFQYIASSSRFMREDIELLTGKLKNKINTDPQLYALNFVYYSIGLDAYKLNEDPANEISVLMDSITPKTPQIHSDTSYPNPSINLPLWQIKSLGYGLAHKGCIDRSDIKLLVEKFINPDGNPKLVKWKQTKASLRWLMEKIMSTNSKSEWLSIAKKIFDTPTKLKHNDKCNASNEVREALSTIYA